MYGGETLGAHHSIGVLRTDVILCPSRIFRLLREALFPVLAGTPETAISHEPILHSVEQDTLKYRVEAIQEPPPQRIRGNATGLARHRDHGGMSVSEACPGGM